MIKEEIGADWYLQSTHWLAAFEHRKAMSEETCTYILELPDPFKSNSPSKQKFTM
jgi:hypothetical protein